MTAHHPPRRHLLVLALVVAITAVPALGASADSEAAADWIAAELDAEEPAFDVFGRTAARADVIFALAAADAREGSVRQALGELAEGAADYLGEPGSAEAGELAKVLLAVLVNREGPASLLPGRDLESELRDLQADDGGFADDTFGHALAMLALGATEAGVPAPAAEWLLDRQSPDGSWPSDFDPDSPDVDVTALSLQALLASGEERGVEEAVAYLVGTQNGDGSWTDAFGLRNANTAGLAGQALRAAGDTGAADLAASFIVSLQTEEGGIRFTAEEEDANGFATLQGVLTLGGPAYHELSADPFADVMWEHLFADEIDWLGDTDVTRGCDPPDNDSFCPDDPVTRGQMAAMLHRALGDELPTGDAIDFTDTQDTVFADDIAWLSATGITRGCTPSTDPDPRYCPGDPITRGQMAAMLHRALAG